MNDDSGLLGRRAPAREVDTSALNRERLDIEGWDEIWLFAYGSLLYKVDFPILERRRAKLEGWSRRFWQGSHDHRGTPESPGRVVTLIPETGACCLGLAYRVSVDVFAHLDHREKNGYLREAVTLDCGDKTLKQAVVYIADPSNAAWMGSASDTLIAQQLFSSAGPSGPNRDYLFQLADALRQLGAQDPHIFSLEKAVQQLSAL